VHSIPTFVFEYNKGTSDRFGTAAKPHSSDLVISMPYFQDLQSSCHTSNQTSENAGKVYSIPTFFEHNKEPSDRFGTEAKPHSSDLVISMPYFQALQIS